MKSYDLSVVHYLCQDCMYHMYGLCHLYKTVTVHKHGIVVLKICKHSILIYMCIHRGHSIMLTPTSQWPSVIYTFILMITTQLHRIRRLFFGLHTEQQKASCKLHSSKQSTVLTMKHTQKNWLRTQPGI